MVPRKCDVPPPSVAARFRVFPDCTALIAKLVFAILRRRQPAQDFFGLSSLYSRRQASITARACQAHGPVLDTTLVAQASVERLDVGVLVGLPGSINRSDYLAMRPVSIAFP